MAVSLFCDAVNIYVDSGIQLACFFFCYTVRRGPLFPVVVLLMLGSLSIASVVVQCLPTSIFPCPANANQTVI